MKRVLITGESSYIGTSFAEFVEKNNADYSCEFISLQSDNWREASFTGFDVILHTAGIVHQVETADNRDLFFEVNRDLTLDVAGKAMADGVRQFVFISTGAVFGPEADNITQCTTPNPRSSYASSKLEAEKGLVALENESFSVAIVRPLMVYGKDCKGNFQTLIGIVKKYPVFPDVHNQRSLIYIDNLSSFLMMIMDGCCSGVFHPQNNEYADTHVIVEEVAIAFGKTVYFSKFLGLFANVFKLFHGRANKAFGDMKYIDKDPFDYSYCICDFRESVRRSI